MIEFEKFYKESDFWLSDYGPHSAAEAGWKAALKLVLKMLNEEEIVTYAEAMIMEELS